MNVFQVFTQHVRTAVETLARAGAVPATLDLSRIVVEPPREASHGDLATNAAMALAKDAGLKPRELAEKIAAELAKLPEVTKTDIAGPGFINLTLDPAVWREALADAIRAGADHGRSSIGAGQPVNVEYVSANPTGPMHVGHCRGAVFGDALANLLAVAGFAVTREYYINDAGAQVDVLARSAFLRYREALGENIGAIPEGFYPGDYLKPVGEALKAEFGDKLKAMSEAQWLPLVRGKAIAMMMVAIREDLAALNVQHDVFFSERSLIEGADQVGATIEGCAPRDQVYEGRLPPPKGAPVDDYEDREQTLFRATAFGDDVDRPLKKSDGSYTYFASDIAYHKSKFDRGFRDMIDVWGADHGGYIKRMKAAVKAVSGDNRRARRQDRAARQAQPRRRRSEDVEALGRVRDAARGGGGGGPRRGALHDALPQERRGARLRHGQGEGAVEGQSGLLRPVRPRPRPFDLPQRRRADAEAGPRSRKMLSRHRQGGAFPARRLGGTFDHAQDRALPAARRSGRGGA